MRVFNVSIWVLFCTSFSFSQTNSLREQDGTRGYDYFKVKRDCNANVVNLADVESSLEEVVLLRDTKVKFNEELDNGDVIFESVDSPYNEGKGDAKRLVTPEKKYYKVLRKDFDNKFVKIFSTSLCNGCFNDAVPNHWFNGTSVVVGVLAIPFKLRPEGRNNSFDFNSGFSLGTTLAIRQRISTTEPYYIGLIGFTGLSSVPLNSLNTSSIRSDEETTDVAAFTYAGGVIFEFNRIQISFILGHDLISNQKNIQWSNHDRNWLSIGLGTYLFSKS